MNINGIDVTYVGLLVRKEIADQVAEYARKLEQEAGLSLRFKTGTSGGGILSFERPAAKQESEQIKYGPVTADEINEWNERLENAAYPNVKFVDAK